jgi:pimeloyl-ACP methyl ester carboxylesterase
MACRNPAAGDFERSFKLNALFYAAAGAGPHPTALMLHGLPGKEQNIDCVQSIRRAGWNVLTIHYRGSLANWPPHEAVLRTVLTG